MPIDIRPASALRTEYNDLAARSRLTGQPIYITRNGEGDTVLMDLNAYTRREEELNRREAVLEHRALVLEAEMEAVKNHRNLAVEKARATKKRRKQIPKNDRSKI